MKVEAMEAAYLKAVLDAEQLEVWKVPTATKRLCVDDTWTCPINIALSVARTSQTTSNAKQTISELYDNINLNYKNVGVPVSVWINEN